MQDKQIEWQKQVIREEMHDYGKTDEQPVKKVEK
jgi:hypothetical protein